MRKNAVILARVSSKEQEDGHSLEAQLVNLTNYAQRHGFNVIETFRIIESSTKAQRPEFERMIEFIRKQETCTALIVDCVDRLQRSYQHTNTLAALMQENKLELHFIREGNVLDRNANSAQKMMWNMGVLMAQSYTDQLSDNVKRSINLKLQKGECVYQAPLGYLNAKDPQTGDSTVILDKERAFLVQRLFREFATGTVSLHELTRQSKHWMLRSKKGHPLTPQTVHNILRNPFYYGIMQVRGQQFEHHYQTLIDKPLFDACKAIYSKNKGREGAVITSELPFTLNGLMTCAHTGRRVSCDIKKGTHIYLVSRHPENHAKKLWTREDVILEEISKIFHSITIPEAVLEPMVDYLRESHESEVLYYREQIKSLRKEADDITQKLDDLTDLLLAKRITQDIYDRKLSQLQNRRMEINALMERHTDADGEFKIALSTLLSLSSRIGELFDRSKPEEKRRLIGFVFSNLQMDGKKLVYSMRKPFDLFVNLGTCKEWPYGLRTKLITI